MLFHEPGSLLLDTRRSIDLVPRLVVILLEFWDKMNLDYLQKGLVRDTETLSIEKKPFRRMLDCRQQQSDRFADITNKNTRSDHFGQKYNISAHFGTN